MAVRGRSYGEARDWDPMRDEYNNSYDQVYGDDDISGSEQVNPRRLYITNIPSMLNDQGLRTAFSHFGTLEGVFVSRDPKKKYGMVTFETPGEAKLAMMKMNGTEPLKLAIKFAQANKKGQSKDREWVNNTRDRSCRAEANSIGSHHNTRQQEETSNGNDMEDLDNDLILEDSLDPEIHLELENLKLQQLKVQAEQLQCKHRMLLLKQAEKKASAHHPTSNIQCILPDGRIVARSMQERSEHRDGNVSFDAGAGDSNDTTVCSCKAKEKSSWERQSSQDSSTPSTCVLYSEDRSADFRTKGEMSMTDQSKKSAFSSKLVDSKTTVTVASKATKRTEYSRDTVSKRSDATSKKFAGKKSELTCDLKYSDFYSDSEEEADETNRLIQLRNADYMDIVEESLKLVIAMAGYPKSKMRLRQMELFQRSLSDVIDMQLKAGLLKKVPAFIDYYLNRGALVCICKDSDTRNWMVRVTPGLQERMRNNLVLLKPKVKRLCLAVLKIPCSCWPATAHDAFKLLQYFNPTLKTETWKIYAQKTVDDVESTSFLIDRVSGEIIRGPTFKNVIDYEQMEFELTGYTEIYYECLLTGMEEDLRSVASRVKLLEELRSEDATPRNDSTVSAHRVEKVEAPKTVHEVHDVHEVKEAGEIQTDFKKELERSLQKEILKKLKDVEYISEKDEVLVWSDETNYHSDNEKCDQNKDTEESMEHHNVISTSGVAVSESESINESNDNLISINSHVNIDSNRGIAYHRRTNYLHVENELKVAITLEGYPQNKLEGTHIRRLKHLFKEYLHKDMKLQRFANLIIPKFQDIYLSNGAVIYVCDSLETKDYLTEVLPKFINSTGLKLTFRDIKSLVRYTRIVMRLPKDHAHVESVEILLKLQTRYPGLKPDCWKYYSDVAGKQKRQFGVDPESLEVIKSPDFDPTYEGDKISFRIIDRQKRDVSFEEGTARDDETGDEKKQRETVLKNMYVPIDQDITNTPLTRIRTNHYSDLIADDLKLYVGPTNYPETRVDEVQFHSIKRTFENVVCASLDKGDLTEDTMPKFHDMYLFDGVIFIISCNMTSRKWIEDNVRTINAKLHLNLKSTEFRGAVGIISMVVKTDKDTDDVIAILQKNNPRLRTKYWRRISTVRTKTKLDVVLQIDKLSALVITGDGFNKFIGNNAVQFKLGHLQSLIKPKASLEELSKAYAKKLGDPARKIALEQPKVEVRKENADTEKELEEKCNQTSDYSPKVASNESCKPTETVYFYTGIKSPKSDLDPIIIEPDSPKTGDSDLILPDTHAYCKVILTIPVNILPENKDDLNIIFDLLEDKNPGLNTEVWQLFTESVYPNNGKFTLFVDKQSVAIIQGKNFDSTIGGERLKFYF